MGKRILAICCTPYQLLVAAQVLACYYPGEEADLILSDQMSGARKLWEQAKDIWPYGQVYYLEERRLNRLAHKENAKNILLGAVASCGVIVLLYLFDEQIRDEDYVRDTFQLPLLAAIPDLTGKSSGSSYYYYKKPSGKEEQA